MSSPMEYGVSYGTMGVTMRKNLSAAGGVTVVLTCTVRTSG